MLIYNTLQPLKQNMNLLRSSILYVKVLYKGKIVTLNCPIFMLRTGALCISAVSASYCLMIPPVVGDLFCAEFLMQKHGIYFFFRFRRGSCNSCFLKQRAGREKYKLHSSFECGTKAADSPFEMGTFLER